MNKKVLTLCAGFLLAGSLTAVAQYCPTNGEVNYRSRLVKAAELDATFQDVKAINQEYYYQLQVDPETLDMVGEGSPANVEDTYVLAVERDYSTGKLYLTAKKVEDAVLTHTLWKISVTDQTPGGRHYTYVNKETGFELSFDHMNALQRAEFGAATDGNYYIPANPADETYEQFAANYGWTFEKDALMGGCVSHWEWYTTEDNGKTVLPYAPIYAYFHNGTDSVIALRSVPKNWSTSPEITGEDLSKIYGSESIAARLGETGNGVDGTLANGFAIIPVKDSKENVEHLLAKANMAVRVRPVVAGAKVLNAAEINTMIDADNSWLSFPGHIANYDKLVDGENDIDRLGKSTKFTVLKPGTNEPLDIVSGTNPFAGEFVAQESGYQGIRRNASPYGLNGQYAGYNILFKTVEPTKTAGEDIEYGYLYVSEHSWEKDTPTGNYSGLKVEIQPYSKLNGTEREVLLEYKATEGAQIPDALEARYHWKVTYYATNDSLVFEPLNASRMSDAEMEAELPFEKTHLATHTIAQWVNTVNGTVAYNGTNVTGEGNSSYASAKGVPIALYAMNNSLVGDEAKLISVGSAAGRGVNASEVRWAAVRKTETGNPAYVTNGESPYQAQMNLRIEFVNDYTYLTRASVESGVYFMNLNTSKYSTAQTEHRVNGAYIVEDMKGHVVYDIEEAGQQDFDHMPATQWVVEQQECIDGDNINTNPYPTVRIYNREFNGTGRNGNLPVFEGQLYTAGDGKMFTIDHRHYAMIANQQTVDYHARFKYNCADTVVFNPVNVNELGYFNEEEDVLRENVYQFQHIYNMAGNNFLGVNDDNNILKLLSGADGTEFELFRAEGWYPVEEWTTEIQNGEVVPVKTDTWRFEYRDSIAYGYPSELANATQLYKTFYKIKLKDENLIDNDHKFIAIDNEHKYVVATESEIADANNHLTFAIFALKENNCIDGTHAYALVNQPQYTIVNGSVSELTGLTMVTGEDEYGNTTYSWENADGETMVELATNQYQVTGKLEIENVSLDAKIADLCETTSDVFALVNNNRPLYRTLDASLVNNDEQVIDIRTVDEQGNESLYEDSNSALAERFGLNYLAAENLGDQTNREGFYVDYVAKSSARMPQYLFVVAADSVPAYKYCDCDIHDVNHGVNASCGHTEDYAGYVEGRFLINFNDSVQNAIDKLANPDAFRSSNYTRLGFVEAVHRGDSLYVLKAPYTLESIKVASVDPAENGKMYICPDSLAADKEGIIYDIVELDGTHNNVAFSLRNTGDTEDSFLIESNDDFGFSQIGSFAGAWVKIINNVPVLAKFYDVNGNHNTGDSTDSWKNQEDWAPVSSTGEVINQAARFTFSAINKDASATANEEISANGAVSVTATDGAVIIRGAEGKNVVIATILGKVVANETINSDNETIAVPAGIAVVSVDGESFKVVVK